MIIFIDGSHNIYRWVSVIIFVELEHGYQTVKCVTAVKKRNPIHVLPVLRVRCSKR